MASSTSSVLILCPDLKSQQTLVEKVSTLGLTSICCETYKDASVLLGNRAFSILICDEALPDATFREVLADQKEQGGRTPVILTSRKADWGLFCNALSAGAFDYVVLPPLPGEVERILNSAIKEYERASSGVMQAKTPGAQGDISMAEYDKELVKLAGNDKEFSDLMHDFKSPGTPFDLNVLLTRVVRFAARQNMLRLRAEQSTHEAFTDELTGLYNWRGFTLLSERLLKLAHREGRGMLLYLLGVNDWRQVREVFGQAEGNRVVQRAAKVLRQIFRDSDVLARWSDDEFAVMAVETSESGENPIQARLDEALKAINAQESRYSISFHLGAVRFDALSKLSLEELMAQAEQAMAATAPPAIQQEAGRQAEQVTSSKPGAKIRVLLADDHAMVREGLIGLLAQEADIEIVGQAADGQEAVALGAQLLPDVILMDISMPKLNGVEATKAITKDYPNIRVIGLSMFEEEEYSQAMLNAGAVNYVKKSGPSTGLINVIRASMANYPGGRPTYKPQASRNAA